MSAARRIRKELNDLFVREVDIDGSSVKTALCNAYRDRQFHRCATGVDKGAADGGEWLYDVLCLRYTRKGWLRRVVMVAECEWGNQDQIWYDFEKLLVARADLRVMVFDGRVKPGYPEIFQTFNRYIQKHKHSDRRDAWLFAAWTPERWQYH